MMHKSYYYCIFLCLVQLTGCGYSPSEGELKDKAITTKEAKMLLEKILLVPDMVIAEYRGTKWKNYLVSGNYKARTSRIRARYYTNQSAINACKLIISYFRALEIWEIYKYASQCGIRENKHSFSSGFSARQLSLYSNNESFTVSVKISEYKNSKVRFGNKWKSSIEYMIYRGRDRKKAEACIKENMPNEVQPCKEHYWSEKRTKIQTVSL